MPERGGDVIQRVGPLFFRGPSAAVRLGVCIVASILLMALDHRESYLDGVRSVLSAAVHPVRVAVDLPFAAGRWMSENLATRERLLDENARLRHERLLLQSRLEKFDHLQAENQRLRALLESSARLEDRVLVAELINVDMDPFSRRIVLNKGTRDGVIPGQSLIDARGIMGQVDHVDPLSSTALLITDPSHALPVQINRSGYRSIAIGTGEPDELKLLHVPNSIDLRVGDLVVTSGLGGRFPAGYPVGHISAIERDRGRSFAEVRVNPSARLERNREVLLIQPAGPAPPGAATPDGVRPLDGARQG